MAINCNSNNFHTVYGAIGIDSAQSIFNCQSCCIKSLVFAMKGSRSLSESNSYAIRAEMIRFVNCLNDLLHMTRNRVIPIQSKNLCCLV